MAANLGLQEDNLAVKMNTLLFDALFNTIKSVTDHVKMLDRKCSILNGLWETTRDELNVAQAEISKMKCKNDPSQLVNEQDLAESHDRYPEDPPSSVQCAQLPESQPLLNSDSVSILKANQDRILHQLQNYSDARDSKTLVINKIGMKKVAMQVYDLTNIWPVMTQELSKRGLEFLLFGCNDIRIFKNGSLRIRYDSHFKMKNAILNLKRFVYNIKKNAENPWFAKVYELTKNLTFSILTPRRFQLQRASLQRIANNNKKNGNWISFEYLLKQKPSGEKFLVLRGFLQNQPGQFVDIKTEDLNLNNDLI